ncbi:hypothetical protein EV663_101135 [Rhodovulum bhavnagarense]|uniref:Uncharacterized protein n=1 Tax=Rhodovulum bhavnagarense TaxID=992286 RepID=A0A4R2RUQ9_9RHOB|nr:hypothetical protein [Rhodovulum bhavnagarense]TCP62875.1 hypothetical protein EV663_101135 [Rhodovulum bhavnagarense]
MIWPIAPNRGLGPLLLGMSPENVARLSGMGRAEHVYRGRDGRMMEYRGLDAPICDYRDGRLCRIVAGRKVRDVQFSGVDLFAAETLTVLRLLETRLGPVTLCAEQLFFGEANLCLAGFYDAHDHQCFDPATEYHDERSVVLFAPGEDGTEGATYEVVSFL